MSAADAVSAIESAARKADWSEMKFDSAAGTAAPHTPAPQTVSWTKQNLTFHFEVVSRVQGGGCDVDYRFTDDEAYIISTKGKANED
jgi:hypothetical protein